MITKRLFSTTTTNSNKIWELFGRFFPNAPNAFSQSPNGPRRRSFDDCAIEESSPRQALHISHAYKRRASDSMNEKIEKEG